MPRQRNPTSGCLRIFLRGFTGNGGARQMRRKVTGPRPNLWQLTENKQLFDSATIGAACDVRCGHPVATARGAGACPMPVIGRNGRCRDRFEALVGGRNPAPVFSARPKPFEGERGTGQGTPHYPAPNSDAINASGALKRPRRRSGGHIACTASSCRGLQSKRARTAISAISGPHYFRTFAQAGW